MKVVLFGATGMIGQGVLQACLSSPDIEQILIIGRTPAGITHAKVREIVQSDLFKYDAAQLSGYDATFFCLGVSAAGMKEADYRKITYDLTLAAANALLQASPRSTFIYISGEGTDSTGTGRAMWARVKGQTENALLKLGFAHAYMFRPGFVQPLGGVKSKTPLYRAFYIVLGPLFPFLRWALSKHMTTSDNVATAMIEAAKSGYSKLVLENPDINAIAQPRLTAHH